MNTSHNHGYIQDLTLYRGHYDDMPILAYDTETPGGEIGLITMSNGLCTLDKIVNTDNVFKTFVEMWDSYDYNEAVIFAHNLKFDLNVILARQIRDNKDIFLSREVGFCFELNGKKGLFWATIENPIFGTLEYGDKVLHLRDTISFFGFVSLKNLGEQLGLSKQKIEIDTALHNNPDSIYNQDYVYYCKRDTETTQLLGALIMQWHREHDIDLCVSVAGMSMKYFRKTLRKPLINCPDDMVEAFERSYHGGKNVCVIDTIEEIDDVNVYDIKSAYPFAMSRMVSFTAPKYERFSGYRKTTDGIYLCAGSEHSIYHTIYNDDFIGVAVGEYVDDFWITSYEYNTAKKHGLTKDWIVKETITVTDNSKYKPLKEWAEKWFKMKEETPKNHPNYMLYKVGYLNSLYGKFIQRNYNEESDIYERAACYNPAIASLITGFCRAQTLEALITYNGLHAATDSVFLQGKMTVTGKQLGDWDLECQGKWLCFGMAKRYIIEDNNGEILKYAKAGFHGDKNQLKEAWLALKDGKVYEYKAPRIMGLKEYFKSVKSEKNMYVMSDYEYIVRV